MRDVHRTIQTNENHGLKIVNFKGLVSGPNGSIVSHTLILPSPWLLPLDKIGLMQLGETTDACSQPIIFRLVASVKQGIFL